MTETFTPTPLSLEEVLDKHRQAMGGLDGLRATAAHEIESRLSGAAPQQQTTLVDELTLRLRVHIEVPELGMKMTRGFDGELAWDKSPIYDGYYHRNHPETLKLAAQHPPLWRDDLPAEQKPVVWRRRIRSVFKGSRNVLRTKMWS